MLRSGFLAGFRDLRLNVSLNRRRTVREDILDTPDTSLETSREETNGFDVTNRFMALSVVADVVLGRPRRALDAKLFVAL